MAQLVGILNVTPDSFSDGGDYFDTAAAITRGRQMFAEGAALVDVGAESTNPHSKSLDPAEEWQRLEPVLTQLAKEFPGKISVDTYHAQTARKAVEAGASIINDVTMFRDPAMLDLATEYKSKARYIISHLSPAAKSIAEAHKLMPTKTVDEVKTELLAQRQELIGRGGSVTSIILDPGIGFGKTDANNWQLNWDLLKFAEQVPDCEVMVGYSRKRFLGEHRMEIEPNLKAAKIAAEAGAKYLRVHDVAATAEFLRRQNLL